MVGLHQCNPQSYLSIAHVHIQHVVAAKTSFRAIGGKSGSRKQISLKDAKKHEEVKGRWSIGYNHSHAAAVSCLGAPSTPISQELGNNRTKPVPSLAYCSSRRYQLPKQGTTLSSIQLHRPGSRFQRSNITYDANSSQ